MNYFIYLHIRHDTKEVFYVGKGKINPKGSRLRRYDRAYSKRGRNRLWQSIVSRTSYDIEIHSTYETEDQAFEKEVELVEFYGRKCLGEGTLINLCKGGRVDPIPFIEKRGMCSTIPKTTPVHVYCAKTGSYIQSFEMIKTACENLNLGHTSIMRALKGSGLIKNYILKKEKVESVEPAVQKNLNISERMQDGVISLYNPDGVLVWSYSSFKEASDSLKMKTDSIRNSLNKNKTIAQGDYKGYFWKGGKMNYQTPPLYKTSEKINKMIDEGISLQEISKTLSIPIMKVYKTNAIRKRNNS